MIDASITRAAGYDQEYEVDTDDMQSAVFTLLGKGQVKPDDKAVNLSLRPKEKKR